MRGLLMLGVGAVFLGGAALAVAQPAPPAPPPAAEAGPAGPGGRPEGPRPGRGPEAGPHHERMRGMMMHGMHGMHRPPPPGASFSFRRGDTAVRIQCSDKEPVQACVDAANALFDKFNAAPR
ncbi:hypothetical protein [Teichococcus aestuarii]|uniref:hypothetical protein n=1 Tax=Teichococcus aestuarii TaxID=568898 RepID=UPI0011B29BFA|nr:hypothetical protein [Pseudoroseomonas aestuarii]